MNVKKVRVTRMNETNALALEEARGTEEENCNEGYEQEKPRTGDLTMDLSLMGCDDASVYGAEKDALRDGEDAVRGAEGEGLPEELPEGVSGGLSGALHDGELSDDGEGCDAGFLERLTSDDPETFASALLSMPRDVRMNEDERRRMAHAEIRAFQRLYPEVEYETLPQSVRASALPLVAAYAIYERTEAYGKRMAERENRRNAERSAGRLSASGEVLYTPEEVRGMSQSEVRAHYDAILRSMRLWK